MQTLYYNFKKIYAGMFSIDLFTVLNGILCVDLFLLLGDKNGVWER